MIRLSDDPVIGQAGTSTPLEQAKHRKWRTSPLDFNLSTVPRFLAANISSLRDERLPKGTRFARESLDADTATGPAFQAGPLPQLISGLRKVKAERGLLDYQWQEI